jgi:quercetin dioxygenase-like cupin family protein
LQCPDSHRVWQEKPAEKQTQSADSRKSSLLCSKRIALSMTPSTSSGETLTQHFRAGLSYVAPPALLFFSILLLAASAAAQTVVPITSEPNHHLAISNDYVRVFKVEVPPKAETLYHQHDYDYLYVAIGDADVTSTRLHEKPVSVKLKDGEVEFSKAPFAHKATNNSDQPFRNVTIEVLRGIGESVCGLPGGYDCGVFQCEGLGDVRREGSSSCVGDVMHTTQVIATSVTLKGKAGITPVPGFYLLVALSRFKLKQKSQNSTQEISAEPGDVFWNSQPGTKLDNLSDPAKFILIGFSSAKTQ